MKKLWQETRDPGSKASINWVSKVIRCITRKRALERRETKVANTEWTLQAIWAIAKSLANKDCPRAPTVIHGPLGPKCKPVNKCNAIADCLKNQFTPYKLLYENRERQEEAKVQALLGPCDLQKLIHFLKLHKACGIDGIPKNASDTFQEDHWFT
jgi:hypothetical protein